MKPIIYGDDEEAKTVSRDVLYPYRLVHFLVYVFVLYSSVMCNSYTCLDIGLRILSPFMPFLTEELFQRLPQRSSDAPPSICVTPFPEAVCGYYSNLFVFTCVCLAQQLSWRDKSLEAQVELMQEVVKTIRSIKQDYLHPKDRPDGW